ncbi:MAG TPA: CGNR zinc finger domain-containing protein [Acidimicrobiia bacterium]|jgi:predicted RNA-binding Zn ribbon-like protein|nr:CGNR zinc finger domain-containing protein [Acidimicrobiia bacterium]
MDFSHYTNEPVRLAMNLVNTRSPLREQDRLVTVADLESFLATISAEWRAPAWQPTEADVAAMRALRVRLREVFNAADDATAGAILNDILAAVHAMPRVSVHDDVPAHLHFEPSGAEPADWVGAVTAMGLSVVLCDHGSSRLGVCGSERCQHVFIDSSRNRSRRFCSDTCATRVHVAAYRRRQKV